MDITQELLSRLKLRKDRGDGVNLSYVEVEVLVDLLSQLWEAAGRSTAEDLSNRVDGAHKLRRALEAAEGEWVETPVI